MKSHDDSSSPHPPIHINEDTHELIRETWMRDCKEIACFHKCFLQVYDVIRDYWVEYDERQRKGNFYNIAFTGGPEISDLDGFQPIRHDLLSNLESLIPGHFNEFPPSASDEEKFEKVRSSIDREWRWVNNGSNKKFERLEESGGPEPFHRALARTLSELHLRRLTKADSTRDLEGCPPSLLQLSLKQVLNQLSKSIEGERATFSCGGSIAIDTTLRRGTATSETSRNPRNSPPVTIYWSGDNEQLYKVFLPYEKPGNKGPSQLDQHCASGTFDSEGTVHRNAGALDEDRFSTSFHPADFGIINTVEQLLLPNNSSQSESRFEFRRIKAELYQLHVHSTTSEIFRHVDTPKSDLFGFLVVCLPSSHEGGQLRIRRNGRLAEFEWSRLSASSIQWAAFYSDCDYEIGQILSGHLITLTYNLYVTEPIGAPLMQDPIVDVMSFPFYDLFKATLENPAFLKNGGALGAFCSHPYPHTSDAAASGLPKALKGTDMALFSVLRSLGLNVEVVPILEIGGSYSMGSSNLAISSSAPKGPSQGHYVQADYNYSSGDDYEEKKRFDDFQKTGKMKERIFSVEELWQDVETDFYLIYRRLFDDFDGAIDLESYWKVLMLAIRPEGIGKPTGSRVGHGLHPYRIYNENSSIEGDSFALEYWNFSLMPGIAWLSSPKHEAPALTCLPHGRKSVETRYSCLAIIAVVPPASERDVSIY